MSCFRLRSYCSENPKRKNSHHILRDRRYTADAPVPVQYRRHNGAFLQVPLLESVLLHVHQAAETSTVPKEVPQSKVHYKITRRVRFYTYIYPVLDLHILTQSKHVHLL